jgi:molecular chaperone DnaK
VKDAELNAAEDKRKLELAQARNQADSMLHSVRKSLAEHGDKLEAGEKEKVESALKALEESLQGEDKADIEARTEALMSASQKLGEKMYAEAQAAAGAGTAAGAASAAGGTAQGSTTSKAAGDADDVVDAEFKEVKK